MLKQLIKHLRANKKEIVVDHEIAVRSFLETSGESLSDKSIEVVDFEKLMEAIDDFASSFEKE